MCGGCGIYAAIIQASWNRGVKDVIAAAVLLAFASLFFGVAGWWIWQFIQGRVEHFVVSLSGISRNGELTGWENIDHIAGQRASRLFDGLHLVYVVRGDRSWRSLRTDAALNRFEYEQLILALSEALGDRYPDLGIG